MLPATLLVCLFAASLAAAERAVSPPVFGAAHSQQGPSDIAWHGDQGFIIWGDWRAGYKYLAYGARIDATGNALDPNGIPLYRGPAEQTWPLRVIWAGDAWLVFWTEGAAIHAQRIGADGSFLGDAVTISTSDHPELRLSSASLSVATNGNTIIVAIHGSFYRRVLILSNDLSTITPVEAPGARRALIVDGGYVVTGDDRVFWISPTGEATSSEPSPFSDPPLCPSCGRVVREFAWTGRDYLMAWKAGDLVLGRRVSSDLSTRGAIFEIARVDSTTVISSIIGEGDGRASLILYRNVPEGFEYQSVSVSATDEVEAPKVLARTGPFVATLREAPSGYVLLRSNLTLQWLSDDFDTLRTTKLEIGSFARQQNMAAVRDGAADLIVFAETRPEPEPDFGGITQVKIGRPGTIARPIFETGRPQDAPGIASNGRNALTAWLEKAGNDDIRLMALPVSLQGEPLRHTPQEIGPAAYAWNVRGAVVPPYDRQFAPVVFWSGQMYLVIWKGLRGTFVARLLEDGTLLDTQDRSDLLGRPDKLTVTRLADVMLLVWSYGNCGGLPCSPLPSTIFAARLTRDGQPIDAQPLVISEGRYSYHPDVAANGATALIVWDSGGEVLARRMTSGGYLYEEHPFRIGERWAHQPSVAKHQHGFYVAWQNVPEWVTYDPITVLGATVSATGEISQPAILADRTFQTDGPLVWTTTSGAAAVAWSRTSIETGFVPRLLYSVTGETAPSRVRSVRR